MHVESPVYTFLISVTDCNMENQIQELNVSLASLQLECGMYLLFSRLQKLRYQCTPYNEYSDP